jgi:hypothetical protein
MLRERTHCLLVPLCTVCTLYTTAQHSIAHLQRCVWYGTYRRGRRQAGGFDEGTSDKSEALVVMIAVKRERSGERDRRGEERGDLFELDNRRRLREKEADRLRLSLITDR